MYLWRKAVPAVVLVIITSSAAYNKGGGERDTLKLVHVLFRHGDRTNDITTTYPNDPYLNETYFPFGIGELTNKGRQREFLLGQKLRGRYGKLIGNLYLPDTLDPFSTEIRRTQMSLLLVLAGLYPPKDTRLEWNIQLNWQPIPYTSLMFDSNRILTLPQVYCPNYINQQRAYLDSPAGQAVWQKYVELFPYISEHSGLDIRSLSDVARLYVCLKAEDEFGLTLPEWTKKIYPEYSRNATIDSYTFIGATPELRRLSGGFLLKKIIEDSKAKIYDQLVPAGRKMFLYSAHEFNIIQLLSALELFTPHIPPYGACVMIELHQIRGVYGIKIFYEDYSEPEPKPLKIPGCDYFCPFEKFVKLLGRNIPTGDDVCEENQAPSKLAR